jgi:hypothetical protein
MVETAALCDHPSLIVEPGTIIRRSTLPSVGGAEYGTALDGEEGS